jgi:hypothetical protein
LEAFVKKFNLYRVVGLLVICSALAACGKKSSGGGADPVDNNSTGNHSPDPNDNQVMNYAGDCNLDNNVTLEELQQVVDQAAADGADLICNADVDGNGMLDLEDLITIVNQRTERGDSN